MPDTPIGLNGIALHFDTRTTKEWANSTKPIIKGALCFEELIDGKLKIKIGDGIHTFSDLPYIGGEAITETQLNEALQSYATNASVDTKLGGYATSESVSEGLSGKVDTIEGMGLSSNDFTDADKAKLDGLENYDDTAIKADIARIDGKDTEQDGAIDDLQTAVSGNTASIATLGENKADKTEIPTSLPANGGNADTLQGVGFSDGKGGKGIISIPAYGAPMEIGQYIDMHHTLAQENDVDFSCRLETTLDGSLTVLNRLGVVADIHANADTVGGYTAEQLIQSNPNLLLNPDFKVNQKGKTEYIGSGYTVDCWKNVNGFGNVTLIEKGVLLKSSNNQDIVLQQNMKKELPPGNYTLSFKYTSDTDRWRVFINNTDYIIPLGQDHVFSLTFTASSPVGVIYFWHFSDIENTLSIEWVKLEFGSVATTFVPPDPLEEVLRCGPIENETQQVLYGDGKWANVPSNSNLLDNPDFRINQRGQTEYSSTTEMYSCDRWKITGKVRPLENGGIEWDHLETVVGAGEQHYCDIIQIRPLDEIWESGKTVTLSACINDQVYSVTGNGAFSKEFYVDGHKLELITWDGPSYRLRTYGSEDYTITVSWMKLELGSVATPFVPPNPATELLKCQYYFERGHAVNLIQQSPEHKQWLTAFRFNAKKRINPTTTISNLKHNTEPLDFVTTVFSDTDYVTVKTENVDQYFELDDHTYSFDYESSADL